MVDLKQILTNRAAHSIPSMENVRVSRDPVHKTVGALNLMANLDRPPEMRDPAQDADDVG